VILNEKSGKGDCCHLGLNLVPNNSDINSDYILPGSFRLGQESSKNRTKLIEEDEAQKLQDGLAKLILALVKILLDVMERQAFRRVESGSLKEEDIERLGRALMKIRDKFQQVSQQFGFAPEELNLPIKDHPNDQLSSSPKLDQSQQTSKNTLNLSSDSLVDLVDKLIEKRTTIAGEITLSLAGIDLVILHLLASLEPVRNSPSPTAAKHRVSMKEPMNNKNKGLRTR
jgi:hypothetical protein